MTEALWITFPGNTAAERSTKPRPNQQLAAQRHGTQSQAELEGGKASITAIGGRQLRKETPTRPPLQNIWTPARSRAMAGAPAQMMPSAQYQRQPTLRGGRQRPKINPTAHPARQAGSTCATIGPTGEMQDHALYPAAIRKTMLAERTVLTPAPRNNMAENARILVPAVTLPSPDTRVLRRSH